MREPPSIALSRIVNPRLAGASVGSRRRRRRPSAPWPRIIEAGAGRQLTLPRLTERTEAGTMANDGFTNDGCHPSRPRFTGVRMLEEISERLPLRATFLALPARAPGRPGSLGKPVQRHGSDLGVGGRAISGPSGIGGAPGSATAGAARCSLRDWGGRIPAPGVAGSGGDSTNRIRGGCARTDMLLLP